MDKTPEVLYESSDKQIVPFLLTQPEVQLSGSRLSERKILFFLFTPFDKCVKLVNDFMSRKAPLVQPKDLLDAVETFRDRIFEVKKGNV